jgi:hypothetical protein
MPVANEPQLVDSVAFPQHYEPATARERRAQVINRLQVGLGGIAVMLLIVGLANIIMDRARLMEDGPAAASSSAVPTPSKGSDPLADIGLVPSPDPTATAVSPQPVR